MFISNNFSINNLYKTSFQSNLQKNASVINFAGANSSVKKVAVVGNKSQDAIKNISENICKLQEFFVGLKEKLNYNPNKISKYKQQYKKFAPTQGKGITFDLGKWYMSVSQLKDHSDILKIFTRKKDGSDPHLFLIEQNGQVYSNAYANSPRSFPKTQQYMDFKQMVSSRVEDQILVADREVRNFLDCMQNSSLEKVDGILSPEFQTEMEEINNSLEEFELINQKALEKGWSSRSLNYHRQKFPSYRYSESNGPSFYDGSYTVSIKKPRKDENLIRLTVKNRYNDTIDALYIKDNCKVLSNINLDYPNAIPNSYKYMTDSQIKECEVEKYISFMNKELKAFNEYLNEQLVTRKPRKHKKCC